MEGAELSSAYLVSDAAAAAVFVNSRLRRILMLFAGKELAVGEAAILANMDLKVLHHHVSRLVRVGLLQVFAERPRAGRPIKLYRAVGASFYISNELLPTASTDQLARELRALLAAEEQRSIKGILVSVGRAGEPRISLVRGEKQSVASFELWRILRLSAGDFAELRAELDATLSKFQSRVAQQGRVYLIHAAGVQRVNDSGVLDNSSGEVRGATGPPVMTGAYQTG